MYQAEGNKDPVTVVSQLCNYWTRNISVFTQQAMIDKIVTVTEQADFERMEQMVRSTVKSFKIVHLMQSSLHVVFIFEGYHSRNGRKCVKSLIILSTLVLRAWRMQWHCVQLSVAHKGLWFAIELLL